MIRIYRAPVAWRWEEAFDKFGFGDGDGEVMTPVVVTALQQAGYQVEAEVWGLHNEVIVSIRHRGTELIPVDTMIGYDDPRWYLPPEIMALLDALFPSVETWPDGVRLTL